MPTRRDLSKTLQAAGGVAVRPADKSALKLADKVQRDLIAQGWPAGKNLGPEGETARHYQTTERVVREAMRVLEWRGVGSVRRGHSGGLVVGSPSIADAGRFLGLYLAAIGCDEAEVGVAGEALLRELDDETPKVRAFVGGLIERTRASVLLAAAGTPDPDRLSASNRALRISYRILRDLNACPGPLTIEDMMERYHVGRPVLVQALRALESVELIRIVRGRAGGVARRRPTPGAMVRTVLPAFLGSGLAPQDFGAILAAANVRCAVGACRSAERLTVLRELADDLDEQAFLRGDVARQVKILRTIASSSGDELSHLFARSVWYYLARQNPARYECDRASARAMLEVTRNLVDCVLSGEPRAADAACRELHRRLGELAVKSVMSHQQRLRGSASHPRGELISSSAT